MGNSFEDLDNKCEICGGSPQKNIRISLSDTNHVYHTLCYNCYCTWLTYERKLERVRRWNQFKTKFENLRVKVMLT